MQHEMHASGKVASFRAPVVAASGERATQQVTRVGPFNAVSGGKFLQWLPNSQELAELSRQPAQRYRDDAQALQGATAGTVRMAVDPSRGSILALLVQTPNLEERLRYGGWVGYGIIGLGAFALVLGLLRLLVLTAVDRRLQRQEASKEVRTDNPLGRILKLARDNADADVETLERKLDEAMVRETSKLERLVWVVKVVSVVAPLMGLLGTVTGMIHTFQAITLFGTGDPKLMAGGISEALVTTMLGLVVAIPLVLMHSVIASKVRRMTSVLLEQSTGFVAERAEARRGHVRSVAA
jgi:biopolymer transport protein ExbB